MITPNINLNVRLINYQFGVVFDLGYNDSPITKVYVKLDDKNAVKEAMSKNFHVTKHKSKQFKGLMQILLLVRIHLKLSEELNFL